MGYTVLDSISSSKREQKKKIHKYALVMIKRQVQKAISLLLKNGIEISEEEIFSIIANEIKIEKSKRTVDSTKVKKKFQSAVDEYLDKTKGYL